MGSRQSEEVGLSDKRDWITGMAHNRFAFGDDRTYTCFVGWVRVEYKKFLGLET